MTKIHMACLHIFWSYFLCVYKICYNYLKNVFKGDELSLECAIHSGIITKVSKSEDFNMIMEGGCTMLCKSLLPCGHYCSSICHPYDREHIELKCREPCNK